MILGGRSSCQRCGCQPVATCFDGAYFETGSESASASGTILASGLSVGPSSITLSNVVIYNDGYIGTIVPATGGGYTSAPRAFVWSNDTTDTSLPYGPRPQGLSVATIVELTQPSSFDGDTWTFTHPGLTLSANTIYWIVLSANGVIATWKYTDYYVQLSETCYKLASFSSNAGASWTSNLGLTYWPFDYS
jgi:hypothetical protein